LKSLLFILSTLQLLLLTSCGVFAKFGKRAKHEVRATLADSSRISLANSTTITGDSIVHIPATSVLATVPITIDTTCLSNNCLPTLDSIITNDIKLYYKPVYHTPADGVKVLQGIQIQAVTPAKSIKPTYKYEHKSAAAIATITVAKVDSTRAEKVLDKKRDNRLGGYTTIILTISLLCVGIFVAKTI
jgi:hypothetical protein